MPAISALVAVTGHSSFQDEQILTAALLNSAFGDFESQSTSFISVFQDVEKNFASNSAPSDNTVEGKIWANTTNDPAEWYGDPDGSGADDRFLTHLGIASGNIWPSFHVHRDGVPQDNITGTDKIEWTTETFDTNSDFDKDTNFRFTPTVAGKYLLHASLAWTAVSAGDNITCEIHKNGSLYAKFFFDADGEPGETTAVTTISDANGSTDYFEVFASNAARSSSDIIGTATLSYFTGSRIA